MGATISWDRSERTRMTFSYAGDVDQYSNIADRDGDSYPDGVDPEPHVFNCREDSIIEATRPPRLDEAGSRQLHAVALGLDHSWIHTTDLRVNIVGEAAIHSSIGAGVSFPGVAFRYGAVRWQAGLDLQTPRFDAQIFDRTYEYCKARVVQKDGGYELVTRGRELAETHGWLWGWNCLLGVEPQPGTRFRLRFRDLHRRGDRDKTISLSLESRYGPVEPIARWSVFVEQRNVSKLFRRRTHGQSWGAQVEVVPHKTVSVRLRYRELCEDSNGDGAIRSGEARRSAAATATVDGTHWWRRFRRWRRGPKTQT
jgi:hypothetical protein